MVLRRCSGWAKCTHMVLVQARPPIRGKRKQPLNHPAEFFADTPEVGP